MTLQLRQANDMGKDKVLLPVKPATGRSARHTIVKAQTERNRDRLPFGAST